MQLAHVLKWLFIVAVTLLVLTLPLLSTERCIHSEIDNFRTSGRDYLLGHNSNHAVPRFGEAASLATGAWLLGVLWFRRHKVQMSQPLQRWAIAFALCAISTSIMAAIQFYLPVMCPSDMAIVRGVHEGLTGLSYLGSQLALIMTCQLRLNVVGALAAKQRGSKLVCIGRLVFAIWLVAAGVSAAAESIETTTAFNAAGVMVITVFVALQTNAYCGLRHAAAEALQEAIDNSANTQDAQRAGMIAIALAASSLSTLAWLLVFLVSDSEEGFVWDFLQQICLLADAPSDAFLAMMTAGLLADDDDDGWASQSLAAVGELVEQRRARLICEKLLASASATGGPALAVAALLQDEAPDVLVERAAQRFRHIAWERLAEQPGIIVDGGLLQDAGAGPAGLYNLSAPCKLGHCDVFFSHSWSDSGPLKMAALQAWAQRFEAGEQRTPSLWLDKVCVDQTSITEDLRCLPVFLAGCNSLLVTSGVTYTTRLWCALELFVYFAMTQDGTAREMPTVLILAEDDTNKTSVMQSWRNFEVQHCRCFHDEDRARIVGVMDQFPGGAHGFNNYIRGLAEQVFHAPPAQASELVIQIQEPMDEQQAKLALNLEHQDEHGDTALQI